MTKVPETAEAPDDARAVQRRKQILDAAISCVRRYGAKKVAVEDIADAAGIGRRTLYRFFPGRRAVMQAVVLQRLEAISGAVKAALAQCDNFEDAVVVGTIETLRLARADKIYAALVEDDPTLTLDRERPGTEGHLETLFVSIWSDAFEDAREKGLLRTTNTPQEAEDWLMDVHRLLALHDDLDDEGIARVIRKFVLPSLMPDEVLFRPRETAT